MPQATGKLTKRRYVGSQLTIDHQSNFCHVAHLEDFTANETIEAKHKCDITASACGNAVRKHRSYNGRFSDKAILKDVNDLGQNIEFCGVRAHHQNGISERVMRTIIESAKKNILYSRRMWPEAMSQAFWSFALSHTTCIHNHLHHDSEGNTN